jgi:SAM-dependent methyltransferase
MTYRSKDIFSKNSHEYAQFRPSYPIELFAYLATLAKEHTCAWDVATGNGQAAKMLTHYFERVIATDLSAKQIEHAFLHEKISYRVAIAEDSKLDDKSIDLITVAQAFHWFHHQKFAKEVARIAKNDAILAIWCYGLLTISSSIDNIIQHFYKDVLGTYWDQERKLVENNYEEVDLPFTSITSPFFPMSAQWTFEHLLGYLRTWSAVQKFITITSEDPLKPVLNELQRAWGRKKSYLITWILKPKIWRI